MDDVSPAMPVPADWKLCQEVVREHGRSFYVASYCLLPADRLDIWAVYAFCRLADDIVDRPDGADQATLLDALAAWEGELTAPVHPVAVAFADVRRRHGIAAEPAHDLIAGIRRDLTQTRYASWEELRHYCHLVAGTVGLMVAPVLGCRDPKALPQAALLGAAMQLTNILRDVAEDAEAGRLYLPLDELARFGCDPARVMAGEMQPGFAAFMAFQVSRARAMYRDALGGVPALGAPGRLATLTAATLYAGILDEIERVNYDVFQGRVCVPSRRRALGVARATVTFARRPLPAPRRRNDRRGVMPTRTAPWSQDAGD